MCDEMRRKLDTDWNRICIDRWTVGWQIRRTDEDEELQKASSSNKVALTKKSIDEDDESDSFSFYCKAGFMFGITNLRIETGYDKYKYIKILEIHSVAEGKHTSLRTNIFWYDRFRPTFWKMNRTIKYARKLRTIHHAHMIEKDLAKIIPDRIDNILLGDKNAKT